MSAKKLIIAPDSYKGTLTSIEVARAIGQGLRLSHPDASIMEYPMADGGEGSSAVLTRYVDIDGAIDCADIDCPVFQDGGERAVFIESARLLGLHHPGMVASGVWRRGSALLGRAIIDALDHGCQKIVVALGGTATHDAGLGLLSAAGARFLDVCGRPVTLDLTGLTRVVTGDMTGLDARLRDCKLTVLCDVSASLLGTSGATHMFAPQKGLEPDSIDFVEMRFTSFVSVCEQSGLDIAPDMSGAGAAGGLGFSLSLCGGVLCSGADWLIRRSGIESILDDADWLVTGEGRSDAQTLLGKLPARLARMALRHRVRPVLLSGAFDPTAREGLEALFPVMKSTAFDDGKPATFGRIVQVARGLES